LYDVKNKALTFKSSKGSKLGSDTKEYILDNSINHANLEKIASISYNESKTAVQLNGKTTFETKTLLNEKAKSNDSAEVRAIRIKNFHNAASEATKTAGSNDKDIESLIKEVKGSSVLLKLVCSQISGFPAVTDDNLTVNGLVEVTLSIDEGDVNPKISFLVVKGVLDVSMSESFYLQETTCCSCCTFCCPCFNSTVGDANLEYVTKKNATSQFVTLPVEHAVIDAMCYQNEDSSYQASSKQIQAEGYCSKCMIYCIQCYGYCIQCYGYCSTCCSKNNSKCCDCCPSVNTTNVQNIKFKAVDTRVIGVVPQVMESRDQIVEDGLKINITKAIDREVFVVFYYVSRLDNQTHKCTMKLKDSGDFLSAKRFVNLLDKYRSKSFEHKEITARPVGQLAVGYSGGFSAGYSGGGGGGGSNLLASAGGMISSVKAADVMKLVRKTIIGF